VSIRSAFQRIALLLGGIALSLYVVFLLHKNYEGQLQLQTTLQEKFQLETNGRADAIGNFFAERLNNIRNLAQSRELAIYFTNKALKMSMQYGLRGSILGIRQRFDEVIKETSIQGKPVFDRLVFVTADGAVLVDTGRSSLAGGRTNWSQYVAPDSAEPRFLASTSDGRVTVTAPYWFKGTFAGEIVAWVSLQRIYSHFLAHPTSSLVQREAIVRAADGSLLLTVMDRAMVEKVSGALAAPPAGTLVSIALTSLGGAPLAVVALRTPIPGTPFDLLTVQPRDELYGSQVTALLAVVLPGFLVTTSVLVVVRYWSRRRELEAERTRTLAEAAATYRSIFESANDVIFVLDAQTGDVIDVNGQAMWQFGYTSDEVKVLGIEGLSARDENGQRMSAASWIAHLRAGDSYLLEWRFRGKSGEDIWSEIGLREGVIGGERRMLAVVRDIGSRKRAELELRQLNEELNERTEEARRMALEAQAAAETKSRFLATMSHEIRTPMNGVLGMAELIAETELSERQRRFVTTMRRSAEALLVIINDVLDFSKMEADMIELDDAPFDLRDLVDEVAELFAERAHRKGLELVCAVAPAVHTALRGDFGRLRQVLANLLSNAIKFTETGEVALRVSCQGEHEVQCLLRFEVADTGIGISSEAQGRIFDSFAQADSSTTRRYGGTGLGLAICKRLVHLLGGEIAVESRLGAGAIFCFTARFAKEEAAPRASLRMPDTLRALRVLVVDDNATNRSLLEEQLAAWGVAHASADGGAAALERLQEAKEASDPFGLILLDKEMPQMDGVELAAEIGRQEGDQTPPIVMLSSVWRELDDAEMKGLGIRAYLTKPLRQSQLYNTLLRVLHAEQPAAEEPVARAASPPALVAAAGRRVLLVEDNPVNQELGREMLLALGLRVDVAEDGERALAALCAERYALVLMDCQMPVLDGLETTRRLRAAEFAANAGVRVPVIALTANAMDSDRQACLDTGMDDYLSKPFSLAQLGEALARWLEPSAHAGHEPVSLSPEPVDAPLDPAALDAVRALQRLGAPDLVQKVVATYLDSAQGLVADLQRAAACGDVQGLIASAHSLKSASANVGATCLSKLCKSIERNARAGELGEVEPCAHAVIEELEVVTQLLREGMRAPREAEAVA
jgi:PAS domain S-box-containing protein